MPAALAQCLLAPEVPCRPPGMCLGGLHQAPVSFYQVKCGNGFHCVSKVGVFGARHDGVYKKSQVEDLQAKYQDAMEDGCPARGVVGSSGQCADDGHGTTHMCWAMDRFEAGAGQPCDSEDKVSRSCSGFFPCVRNTTNAGAAATHNRYSKTDDGNEVVTGVYDVQPPNKCYECAQFDCDQQVCQSCPNCEYTTKTIAGRKTKGCFAMDGGLARLKRRDSRDGRAFLSGKVPFPQEIKVVPHYPIYDPKQMANSDLSCWKTSTCSLPYEEVQEPLSHNAWIQKYKQAAPKVQFLLDKLVGSMVRRAQKHAFETEDCFDKSRAGIATIPARYEKLLSVQTACQDMSRIADQIAHKQPFEAKVDDMTIGCQKGEDSGGMCEALNCHTSDPKLKNAVKLLLERNEHCYEVGKKMRAEEAKNGPPPPFAQETEGGGRVDTPAGVEALKKLRGDDEPAEPKQAVAPPVAPALCATAAAAPGRRAGSRGLRRPAAPVARAPQQAVWRPWRRLCGATAAAAAGRRASGRGHASGARRARAAARPAALLAPAQGAPRGRRAAGRAARRRLRQPRASESSADEEQHSMIDCAPEVEQGLRKVLVAKESTLGRAHAETISWVCRLARALADRGQAREAEALFRRALEEREVALGAKHPDTTTSLHDIGRLLHRTGRLAEAERFLRLAVEWREGALGQDHPDALASLEELAMLLKAGGNHREAEQLFSRAGRLRCAAAAPAAPAPRAGA
ncbi:unnamed protein product [Prorocentrum cordatum]|uniref:Kinesin light chain n=1 Tax=Prorocentrum cordatum TaxID=2364126 RepID=A0ABN9W545_9DINO|nr:unnamed protein product [Polarella glacialis]